MGQCFWKPKISKKRENFNLFFGPMFLKAKNFQNQENFTIFFGPHNLGRNILINKKLNLLYQVLESRGHSPPQILVFFKYYMHGCKIDMHKKLLYASMGYKQGTHRAPQLLVYVICPFQWGVCYYRPENRGGGGSASSGRTAEKNLSIYVTFHKYALL